MKNKIIAIVGILVLVVGTFATVKKVSPISWGMWGNYNTASGIALKGYDPVAYIQNSEAMLCVRGQKCPGRLGGRD